VDAVEPECPYIMNDEYLMGIIEKWKIDYVVHGDDPCIVDGKGVLTRGSFAAGKTISF
jgi:ethanolamine-phosphate cytidylyltransferase